MFSHNFAQGVQISDSFQIITKGHSSRLPEWPLITDESTLVLALTDDRQADGGRVKINFQLRRLRFSQKLSYTKFIYYRKSYSSYCGNPWSRLSGAPNQRWCFLSARRFFLISPGCLFQPFVNNLREKRCMKPKFGHALIALKNKALTRFRERALL
jgi:hypothetical protein